MPAAAPKHANGRRVLTVGSEMVEKVVEGVGLGALSITKARALAEASAKSAGRDGASDDVEMQSYASMGTDGRKKGNIHREAVRWFRRSRGAQGNDLELYLVDVKVKCQRGLGKTTKPHPVLLRTRMVRALFESGGDAWPSATVGTEGLSSVSRLREHESKLEWFRGNPAAKFDKATLERCLTFGMHFDDVQDVKTDKKKVIKWDLEHALQARATNTLLLLNTLRLHLIALGVFCVNTPVSIVAGAPATIETGVLTQRIPKQSSATVELLTIDVDSCPQGTFRERDHAGNEWPANSYGARHCGEEIAGGWRLAFSELRSDLDFLAKAFRWNNFRMDELCHRCWASSHAARMWTDVFFDSAAWSGLLVGTAEYFANTTPDERCPLVNMPGWDHSRALGDTMHGLNLGVAQHVAGSTLMEDCVEHCRFRGDWQQHLETRWHELKAWCRLRRVSCSHPCFTKAQLNIQKSGENAVMKSKAANARTIIFWLADKSRQTFAQRSPRHDGRDLPRALSAYSAASVVPRSRGGLT